MTPAPTPLTTASASITDYVYDSNGYGNVTQVTNGIGTKTQYTYDSNNLYAQQRIEAFGTSVARTFNYLHDFNSGRITEDTDVDNGSVTLYGYDGIGRTVLVQAEDVNGALVRQTSIYHEDGNRRLVNETDLLSAGDLLLRNVTDFDQLGRVRLIRKLEDASSQPVDDDTAGIKVQTRYLSGSNGSYVLTSNPYRASYASGATGETTMGWNLTFIDRNGRLQSVVHYSGVSLPVPFGAGNPVSTGSVHKLQWRD